MECGDTALQILVGSRLTVTIAFCILAEGLGVAASGRGSLLAVILCDFGWIGVWGLNRQVVVTLFILTKNP